VPTHLGERCTLMILIAPSFSEIAALSHGRTTAMLIAILLLVSRFSGVGSGKARTL